MLMDQSGIWYQLLNYTHVYPKALLVTIYSTYVHLIKYLLVEYSLFEIFKGYFISDIYIVSVILSYSHYQVVIVALKSGGLPVDMPSDTEPFNYNKTSYNQVSFY